MRRYPPRPLPQGGGTTPPTLITTWYGTFLVEEGEVLDDRRFPEDPDGIAARLERLEAGEVLEEERELVEDLEAFLVAEQRLKRLPGATFAELDVMPAAVEKAAPDPSLLQQATMAEAERKTAERASGQILSQAVQAMDELQRMVNLFDERLREWRPISEDAGHPADETAIDAFEQARGTVAKARGDLESHVEDLAEELCPNVSALVDPLIAARLVGIAGSVEKLARMPAGTIQTLGAENALFAHLTEGADPPKHGVIYQNPKIHRAPYKARGKISRALAAKVAIAARADAYTGADIADDLLEELERRIGEAKERAGVK